MIRFVSLSLIFQNRYDSSRFGFLKKLILPESVCGDYSRNLLKFCTIFSVVPHHTAGSLRHGRPGDVDQQQSDPPMLSSPFMAFLPGERQSWILAVHRITRFPGN